MFENNPAYNKYRNKEWLYQNYIIEEKSSHDIAKIVGCGVTTVRRWMKGFGIERRNNREAGKNWYKNHDYSCGMYGKKHSEESKRKMSESSRGKPAWNKGIPFSKETCQKMSDHAKRRFKNRENVPAWKGGITLENKLIRTSLEFMDWRKSVFERDDYVCQKCLERGGELHAHHIIPFAIAPKERLELDNGATLCKPCHKTIHMEEY